MEQHPGYSPSFKRPSEILRMRKRRVGPGPGCAAAADPRPLQSRSRAPYTGGTKRRNPFAHLEPKHCLKKNRVAELDGEENEEEEAFSQRDFLPPQVCNDEYPEADHQEKSPHQKSPQEHHPDHQEKSPQADHNDHQKSPQEHRPDHQKSPQADHNDHRDMSWQVHHQDHREKYEQADHLDHRERSLQAAEQDQQENIRGHGCDYPTDWSLKTRLVFTSPLSLSWAEQPRAQEEALGLHLHCRAHFKNLPLSFSDPCSCTEIRAAFQQALVYWQHPSLPWLSLFPRVNADRNFNGHNCPWTVDGTVQQSLRSQWALSLSSLYALLKCGLCPYFYLCAYQFTVLFRAASLGGSSNITALMSPTTRGLRQSMEAEGIEFSLPLVEEMRNSRRGHAGEEEDRLQEVTDLQHSDGDNGDSSFCWLKEMGVHDKIKTPEGLLLQLQNENPTVSLDHKPESVVLVEGLHTFTLVNFLINSKSIVAAAGSQAGLPPTLLSPVAFRGGTMHMLKSHCVNVKSQVDFSYQNVSSLEITGPVLPSSLHTIIKLLQRAQDGNFWAIFSTHTPTAVLNTQPHIVKTLDSRQQGAAPAVDHNSWGVHPESFQQLQQPSILGKTALTHIKMSHNRLSWRS